MKAVKNQIYLILAKNQVNPHGVRDSDQSRRKYSRQLLLLTTNEFIKNSWAISFLPHTKTMRCLLAIQLWKHNPQNSKTPRSTNHLVGHWGKTEQAQTLELIPLAQVLVLDFWIHLAQLFISDYIVACQ